MQTRPGTSEQWAEFSRSLGVTLRQRRAEVGMTQERVAELTDISLYAYQQYERGTGADGRATNPRLATILSICQALDTSIEDLLPPIPPLARSRPS